MPEAVIVDCLRTAVGKATRGALRNTRPDDLAAAVIRALLARYPQVPKEDIEDVILGCAMPEAESGQQHGAHGRAARGPARHHDRRHHQPLLQFRPAVDRHGGRPHSGRRRAHPHRGRRESMSMIPDGRQQARAQSLVRRSSTRRSTSTWA